MRMRVKVTKRPPPVNVRMNRLRSSVNGRWKKVGGYHLALRKRLVGPWSDANTPKFSEEMDLTGLRMVMAIKMEANAAEGAELSAYTLVDQGTDVKYIDWTADFQAKTRPGSMISGPGQGQVYFSKEPKPGIKARRYEKKINEALEGKMDEAVREGLADGFRRIS